MNVTEIINQVLARDDNVSETDADNATRRTRLLEYLREVVAEVWWRRDWTFKKKRDTVTVPAGQGYVSLPADFASIGIYGGVYLPRGGGSGDGAKLEMKPESVITDVRESGVSNSLPTVYALFGQDPTTYLQYIQIPTNPGAVTLAIWYQPNQPTIDEGANVENINMIPSKYHQLVIVPGLRAKARESKGDARWQTAIADYEKGFVWMQSEENRFQGEYRQLPSFFGRGS